MWNHVSAQAVFEKENTVPYDKEEEEENESVFENKNMFLRAKTL